MYERVKKLQQIAAPEIEKRNQFVIEKGNRDFKKIGALHDLLQQDIAAVRTQMQEDQFVQVFLPFFAVMNLKEEEREKVVLPYPVTIEHWIGAINCDVLSPVDIINSRGEVIIMQDGTPLTIPPVYNRNAIKPLYAGRGENNAGTGQIMEEVRRVESMGESTMLAVMGKYLHVKSKAARVKGVNLPAAIQWNKIMQHYGKPLLYPNIPMPNSSVETNTASAKPGTVGNDDFEYELP